MIPNGSNTTWTPAGKGKLPTGVRRRHRARVNLSINLAPMIDMTFLLLIFFLVTTTFERAEGILASAMPDSGSVTAVPLPLSPIVVRLERTGEAHEDIEVRVDQFPEASDALSDLAGVLDAIHGQKGFDEETPVVIIAGDDVPWDHVVESWNAALRAGCKRIAFGEQP